MGSSLYSDEVKGQLQGWDKKKKKKKWKQQFYVVGNDAMPSAG